MGIAQAPEAESKKKSTIDTLKEEFDSSNWVGGYYGVDTSRRWDNMKDDQPTEKSGTSPPSTWRDEFAEEVPGLTRQQHESVLDNISVARVMSSAEKHKQSVAEGYASFKKELEDPALDAFTSKPRNRKPEE